MDNPERAFQVKGHMNRKSSFAILATIGLILLVLALYYRQFEQILAYV